MDTQGKVTPALTPELRAKAFNRSLEIRQQRSRFKARLGTLDRSMALKVLVVALSNTTSRTEVFAGSRVYDLLRAVQGVGPKKAERWLSAAGIPLKNTVRACGPKQTAALIAQLDK